MLDERFAQAKCEKVGDGEYECAKGRIAVTAKGNELSMAPLITPPVDGSAENPVFCRMSKGKPMKCADEKHMLSYDGSLKVWTENIKTAIDIWDKCPGDPRDGSLGHITVVPSEPVKKTLRGIITKDQLPWNIDSSIPRRLLIAYDVIKGNLPTTELRDTIGFDEPDDYLFLDSGGYATTKGGVNLVDGKPEPKLDFDLTEIMLAAKDTRSNMVFVLDYPAPVDWIKICNKNPNGTECKQREEWMVHLNDRVKENYQKMLAIKNDIDYDGGVCFIVQGVSKAQYINGMKEAIADPTVNCIAISKTRIGMDNEELNKILLGTNKTIHILGACGGKQGTCDVKKYAHQCDSNKPYSLSQYRQLLRLEEDRLNRSAHTKKWFENPDFQDFRIDMDTNAGNIRAKFRRPLSTTDVRSILNTAKRSYGWMKYRGANSRGKSTVKF